MRILSWGAPALNQQKIRDAIALFDPDVLCLQEVEETSIQEFMEVSKYKYFYFQNKDELNGIAMLFKPTTVEVKSMGGLLPDFQYIVPFVIECEGREWNLLNIWSLPFVTLDWQKKRVRIGYKENTYQCLHYYQDYLKHPNTVLVGVSKGSIKSETMPQHNDFKDTVSLLDHYGYKSLYHEYLAHEPYAGETQTTQYNPHNGKRYHTSYMFLHETKFACIKTFYLGTWPRYGETSLHLPLFLEVGSK